MGFQFEAVEAKREKVSVRVGLSSSTGGGKSWGALLLATGMCKEMGVIPKENILYLGTEKDRDLYYADTFAYSYIPLSAPFSPEMFEAAIKYGNENNFKVIIVDSASHEWEGEGGVLDIHNKMPGNSFTNWGKVKPRHKKFVDAMISSDAHIICCMRSKMKNEIVEGSNGKKEVKKLGLGVQGDSNLEYEMTTALALEQDTHIFDSSSKDNTGLFEGRNDLIKEIDGVNLIKWANDGVTPDIKIAPKEVKTLQDVNPKMYEAFKALGKTKYTPILKKYGLKTLDELANKSREVAGNIYNECNKAKA